MSRKLTIVISTYNRKCIIEENIKKMLKYSIDVDFIIGDNASTDNTWKMLSTINDNRVRVFKNDINLDINNAYCLAFKVETEYFLLLNDRDYIEEESIKILLELINDSDYELISSVYSKQFKEKINPKQFCYLYFLANHPGCMIYNTEYYKKNIDKNIIYERAVKGESEFIYNYITLQLLINYKKVYYRPITMIIQPDNRDKIVQTRREQYGSAYVTSRYHINAFKARISLLTTYEYNCRVNEFIRALYKSSIRKVELEYFVAVKSEDFRIRNHCEQENPSRWLKNGIEYTKYVLENNYIVAHKMRNAIIGLFMKETFFNLIRIVRMKINK